jgi:hypothetical protein
MKSNSKGYGSLRQQADNIKIPIETSTLETNISPDLDFLIHQHRDQSSLRSVAPGIDEWECRTTLACAALNMFSLAFSIVTFVPITSAFQSDFGLSLLQVI